MTRLVCVCGTIIPAERAGGEHCSAACEEAADRRDRDEVLLQLLDDSAQQLSEWYQQQRIKELTEGTTR
jgi:hypothetical protein